MMVLIQIMAPVEAALGAYNWFTVGRIPDPKSLDIEYLKQEVRNLWMKKDAFINIDALRLVVMKDSRAIMKITLPDFFRKEMK